MNEPGERNHAKVAVGNLRSFFWQRQASRLSSSQIRQRALVFDVQSPFERLSFLERRVALFRSAGRNRRKNPRGKAAARGMTQLYAHGAETEEEKDGQSGKLFRRGRHTLRIATVRRMSIQSLASFGSRLIPSRQTRGGEKCEPSAPDQECNAGGDQHDLDERDKASFRQTIQNLFPDE